MIRSLSNTSSPLLDPDDVGTVVVVGGTGAAVGGSTALALLALRKLRDGGRYLGVEDGIVIVKHLPRVKKKDDDSDHYFKRGLIRQQEMTKSADCLLYTSPSPRDVEESRMPSSA